MTKCGRGKGDKSNYDPVILLDGGGLTAFNVTAVYDADSEYACTYDNLGRVLTSSNSGTSGVPTVVLTSAYDANSNRTSLAATRGGTADFLNSYTFDNLGRMTRVEQMGNGGHTVASKRVDFAYNALGQFSTITRQVKPSSTWNEVATSTFTYDSRNRLTALDHKHSTTDIANYDWTYDAMDRVLQFSGPDGISDYTYDKESQVTATDHSFQTDESYTYTATGNRTGGGYSVASNNRMSSDGTYNYTYDDEGNRLTRTKISDNSLTEYTWDHRNRLTKVVERAAGVGQPITKQTDYKYDVFDRRISKSYDADGAGGGSAVVSRYVYDGNHIALQFDGSNNLTHRYLHGSAIDLILADEDSSNDILWPLTDSLGTVRDLVDDSGTIENHLEYDTFGRVTAESNAAVDHIFGYTGRERDEETGLAYYRKRYYDPTAGSFLSHDPSGFAAGDTNLSRYVGNNPANWRDPSGLLFAGGIGAAMEDLGMPEAAMAQQHYEYNLGQVNIIPQPELHPEWGAGQQSANAGAGIADAGLDLLKLTSMYSFVESNPWSPFYIPIAATYINFVTQDPDFIDTNSVAYIGGYMLGDTVLGMAAEAALAHATNAAIANTAIDNVPSPGSGGCFVIDTPVLMGGSPYGVSSARGTHTSHDRFLHAWSIMLVGVGVASLIFDAQTRRKRDRVARREESADPTADPQSTDSSVGGSGAEPANKAESLFCDLMWLNAAPATGVTRLVSPAAESPGKRGSSSLRYALWATWLRVLGCLLIVAGIGASLYFRPNDAAPNASSAVVSHETSTYLAPIQDIQVGQRVIGENPTGEFDDSLGREVDPPNWRTLTLRAPKRDGTHADVVLLRPAWWLEARAVVVGGKVFISVPECGIDGNAEVLSIDPCPELPAGQGHAVIGTFRHESAQVLDLYVEGQQTPIGATANHPFWSEDRQTFVRADALVVGETLLAASGSIRVRSIKPRSESAAVFNIEVLGQHVYRVGPSSLLVHNAPGQGPCPLQLLQIEPLPTSANPGLSSVYDGAPANFSTPGFGTQVHQNFPQVLMDQTNTLPEHWKFNTAPGMTGVDAEYVGGAELYPGFKYAELKPYSINGWETLWGQLEAWALPPGETQLWFYNEGGIIGSSGNNY